MKVFFDEGRSKRN